IGYTRRLPFQTSIRAWSPAASKINAGRMTDLVQCIGPVGRHLPSGMDANAIRGIFGQVEHLRLPGSKWPGRVRPGRLGASAACANAETTKKRRWRCPADTHELKAAVKHAYAEAARWPAGQRMVAQCHVLRRATRYVRDRSRKRGSHSDFRL